MRRLVIMIMRGPVILPLLLLACHGADRQESLPPKSGDWGVPSVGLRTRLTILDHTPGLGEPVRVRLEMENVGTDVIAYDWQQVAVNNAFDVQNLDGSRTVYVGGSVATAGGEYKIEPGEIVVLFDDLDVAGQYHLSRAGRYIIRHGGRMLSATPADKLPPMIPDPRNPFESRTVKLWNSELTLPSNVVQVDVRPGPPTARIAIVDRLLGVLKPGWELSIANWEGHIVVFFSRPAPLIGDGIRIPLAFGPEPPGEGFETWGSTDWGRIHAGLSPRSREAWPDLREAITAALDVRTQ